MIVADARELAAGAASGLADIGRARVVRLSIGSRSAATPRRSP
jgi:hypothetical protein